MGFNVPSPGRTRFAVLMTERPAESDLSEADREAIEHTHALWIAEELANNPLSTLQFCTEDVVWIPPSAPSLIGRAAIETWLSGSQVDIRDVKITNLRIHGEGSIAYLTSDYATTYKTRTSTTAATATGTHLWILRKMSDGEWKLAILTWNSCDTR